MDERVVSSFKTPDWRLFVTGGIANSCGQTVAHPVDVMKVRLQLDNELIHDSEHARKYQGMIRGMRTLMLEEGYMAVWNAWRAAILREMTFGGLRFMFYEPIKYQLGGVSRSDTPILIKIQAGAAAGGLSAAIVTPTDLVKTRLQAQVTGEPARHTGCIAAFRDIYRDGGVRALYTGCSPNILRATLGTCAQITSYDHTKHALLNAHLMTEGVPIHIISSAVAGLVNAIVSTPVDLVRTRLMNQPSESSQRKYRSIPDVMIKTVKSEGILCLYKGFLPVWMRIAPHTVVSFAVFEQLRLLVGVDPV